MGLHITLQYADGTGVREMLDPFGGTFDASGEFDELLNRGASPLLDALDPYALTTLLSSDMAALTAEVDALLAMIPEHDRVLRGRVGITWRGLVRFRVMVGLCGADRGLRLRFAGD